MRPVHRFEEAVAGAIDPDALLAIIDRHLAFEDIAEQRHDVFVPAGLASGLNGHQRSGYIGRAARIGDLLIDDRLVAGKDRRQQCLISRGRCRRLRRRGGLLSKAAFRNDEAKAKTCAGGEPLQHRGLLRTFDVG